MSFWQTQVPLAKFSAVFYDTVPETALLGDKPLVTLTVKFIIGTEGTPEVD